MIVHSTDGIACLSIGCCICDDSGAALFPPLAALPIHFILVGGISQVSMLSTVQHAIPGRCLNEVYVLHSLGHSNALHLWLHRCRWSTLGIYNLEGHWKTKNICRWLVGIVFQILSLAYFNLW